MCCVCVCVHIHGPWRGRSTHASFLSVEPDVSVQELARHVTQAHGLLGAGLAALQALEDVAHGRLRHALLLEESDLHHERKEERGERAELRRGHEHVDLVRVEGRAAEEAAEEEAADKELGEDREEAPLLDEGCATNDKQHRLENGGAV
eukprot:scaffold33590_cov69-Phaeocystis_antarctica.AAC.3